MVSESLWSLSSLYITPCGIEGKSPETHWSYTETLKLFIWVLSELRARALSWHAGGREADPLRI